jgi:hypothetical protein
MERERERERERARASAQASNRERGRCVLRATTHVRVCVRGSEQKKKSKSRRSIEQSARREKKHLRYIAPFVYLVHAKKFEFIDTQKEKVHKKII